MRHIVGLVCCIAMLGALLFLAASLSAQPTGTPITAHTTLAVGQNGRIGSETIESCSIPQGREGGAAELDLGGPCTAPHGDLGGIPRPQ